MFGEVAAWLVDFDGTLTDYEAADGRALEALRGMWCPHVASGEFADAARWARTAYYARASASGPGIGLDASRLDLVAERLTLESRPELVPAFQTALREATVALAGARDLLVQLRRMAPVALVTNAYDAAPQLLRITAAGLDDVVDDIVVAAEVGLFKPDPALLRVAAARLGVDASDCVVIGDSVTHDIAGAHAAGMASVLVGGSDSGGADVHVPHLEALRALLPDAPACPGRASA